MAYYVTHGGSGSFNSFYATLLFFILSKRELSNLSDDWLHGSKRKKKDDQSTEDDLNDTKQSLNATMMWKKMWQQKRARECTEVLDDIISQVVEPNKDYETTHEDSNETMDTTNAHGMHAVAAEQRITDFLNSPEEVLLRKLASGELGTIDDLA